MTVSLFARQHDVAVAQRALTAASNGEEVAPASDYRGLAEPDGELDFLIERPTAGIGKRPVCCHLPSTYRRPACGSGQRQALLHAHGN